MPMCANLSENFRYINIWYFLFLLQLDSALHDFLSQASLPGSGACGNMTAVHPGTLPGSHIVGGMTHNGYHHAHTLMPGTQLHEDLSMQAKSITQQYAALADPPMSHPVSFTLGGTHEDIRCHLSEVEFQRPDTGQIVLGMETTKEKRSKSLANKDRPVNVSSKEETPQSSPKLSHKQLPVSNLVANQQLTQYVVQPKPFNHVPSSFLTSQANMFQPVQTNPVPSVPQAVTVPPLAYLPTAVTSSTMMPISQANILANHLGSITPGLQTTHTPGLQHVISTPPSANMLAYNTRIQPGGALPYVHNPANTYVAPPGNVASSTNVHQLQGLQQQFLTQQPQQPPYQPQTFTAPIMVPPPGVVGVAPQQVRPPFTVAHTNTPIQPHI